MENINQIIFHDMNISLILQTVRDFQPISRSDIVQRTNLAPSTVSVIMKELQERQLIRECGRATSTGGRRPILLEINPKGGYFISVDLSGASLTVGVLDFSFQVMKKWDYSLGEKTGGQLFEYVIEIIAEAHAWCGASRLSVFGIGIATPGLVDSATGTVVEADNLKWYDFDIRKEVQQRFDCQVIVENDTNAAAFGEYKYGFGQDHPVTNMMYVTIGTGIGAGFVLNGELYTGSMGMAGEIGHTVVDIHGEKCTCGNIGCVETFAASPAMLSKYRKQSQTSIADISELMERAENHDECAFNIVTDAGRAIGLAIGNQVNVLNLDAILVGGTTKYGRLMWNAVMEGVNMSLLPKLQGTVTVHSALLDSNAGLIGVASLALNRIVEALNL